MSPPSAVFPVVWGILYALMGISAYIVKRKEPSALSPYILQLVVNFSWSIVFFRFRLLALSAVVSVILLIVVGIMIMRFCKVSKTSAVLNVPYLLWSAFAVYLSTAIYVLN